MRLSIFFTASLCLFSTTLATKYPLTVTDDLGRRITLKSEPQRIVTMLPSHTETLAALGAADKLVGVDEFSNYPKAVVSKLPKMGNGYKPDIEAIVALKPDLVLVDESSGPRLAEKLSAVGLTVYGGTAQTYNEVFQKIGVLGKITNKEAQAVRLITKMRSELNELKKSVAKKPKYTVYYEIDPTPYSIGPKSFMGNLLSKAGGKNIIPAELGDFPKIDSELVVKKNPQVMIGLTLEEAQKRGGWNKLKAVTNKRVYKPTNEERDALSRPGPRLPDALKALIRMIHKE